MIALAAASAVLLAIIWVGYPAFMRLTAMFVRPQSAVEPESWPSVTAIVASRENAEAIRARAEDLIAADYAGSLDVVVALDAAAGAIEAALAPMPVEFTVPAHATHLDTVPLMIAPRVTSGGRAEPVDLYLMWAFRPDSRFIAPDGAWSSEPIPVRRSVKLADLAPFTVNWRADPVGAISIALIAVKTGGHPIDRAGWIWAPELSWVTVRPAWALEGRIQWLVAGLGLGALSSITVLFLYARRA